MATALAHSINTVAVRLANEVGVAKLAEIAHRFGLKSIPNDPTLSIALGAYEVNLLELTSAYQVLQQGGQRSDPYLVAEIDTQRGDVVYSHPSSSGVMVYDVNNAGMMVRMMEGVITTGTGIHAGFGRPAAGKTGTTSDWKDAPGSWGSRRTGSAASGLATITATRCGGSPAARFRPTSGGG